MSVGGVLLMVNAIVEWNWKERWERLKNNKLAIVLSSFALLFCLGLIKTDNWQSAADLIIMKGPILFAPLVIATSAPLKKTSLNIIIHCFLFSILFTTIYSFCYYIIHKQQIANIREISIFISHIRFSLFIDLAIVFAFYYIHNLSSKKRMIPYFVFVLWSAFYLFVAQTLTGILILMIVAVVYALYRIIQAIKMRNVEKITFRKCGFYAFILCLFFFLAGDFIYLTFHYFHDSEEGKNLETSTMNGNPYSHDKESIIENGTHIYYYVCSSELKSEWEKNSDVAYDEVEHALIRYLNSMGYHKDSLAVSMLSAEDISNIERGIANVYYTQTFGLKKALYPTFFGISLYKSLRRIENSSLLQRVELWRYSWKLIEQHPVFGVGVGDDKQVLDLMLEANNSPLQMHKNMGCHNQFLTFWLSCGIFVLLGFIFVLFFPFFVKGKRSMLYIMFFLILFFSFFTEDTLNTSTGVYLYTFFNSLILFGFEDNRMEKQTF